MRRSTQIQFILKQHQQKPKPKPANKQATNKCVHVCTLYSKNYIEKKKKKAMNRRKKNNNDLCNWIE